jgi:hypothetical protein
MLDRSTETLSSLSQVVCGLVVSLRFKDRGETFNDLDLEPRKPHTLALAVTSDLVHAVVPVTAADQGQTVLSDRFGDLQGTETMVKDGSLSTV